MQINGISDITSKLGTWGSSSTQKQSSFADVLTEALNNAQNTEASAAVQNKGLLTGETDDLHTPIIEAQKAELALNLAIQIRNKVISAYNDVMGMQL